MRKPKLVPYETIIRATSGKPEAVDEVLQHYSRQIRLAALENGHINKDTENSIPIWMELFRFLFITTFMHQREGSVYTLRLPFRGL